LRFHSSFWSATAETRPNTLRHKCFCAESNTKLHLACFWVSTLQQYTLWAARRFAIFSAFHNILYSKRFSVEKDYSTRLSTFKNFFYFLNEGKVPPRYWYFNGVFTFSRCLSTLQSTNSRVIRLYKSTEAATRRHPASVYIILSTIFCVLGFHRINLVCYIIALNYMNIHRKYYMRVCK